MKKLISIIRRNTMSRIELNDNLMSIIVKMAEGNPGAATVLMELYSEAEAIDPQSAMGGLGPRRR